MEATTLQTLPGVEMVINNLRPHNSRYRLAFSDGTTVCFTVTAGGSFTVIGNGSALVINIDDDFPAGVRLA